jgi:hypothetical protein
VSEDDESDYVQLGRRKRGGNSDGGGVVDDASSAVDGSD